MDNQCGYESHSPNRRNQGWLDRESQFLKYAGSSAGMSGHSSGNPGPRKTERDNVNNRRSGTPAANKRGGSANGNDGWS